MNMTKKHLSRITALAAAAVITAGVPLTMQRGAASKISSQLWLIQLLIQTTLRAQPVSLTMQNIPTISRY